LILRHLWQTKFQGQLTSADFSYVDKSDEQLRQHVEKAVRERVEEYAKADLKDKGRIGLWGFLILWQY
jgi:hypothetical protein